jgi:dTDP-glucose 4,6-dehydratase
MKRYLITGGCGFFGHHFIEHTLKKDDDSEVVVIDRLTYASNGFDRLRDIEVFDSKRVKVFTHDFTQPFTDSLINEITRDGKIDYIIHAGAETHVDNSITNAYPFVISNVLGTYNMLELAKILKPTWFVYFSTDEVFGPAPEGVRYKEWDRYNAGNPYAATKAGGEELALAYANTHKINLFVSHTMNLVGERQHFEKFVPLVIRKCLLGEKVMIHANADLTKSGTRFYLHCRNAAAAIHFLLDNAIQRDKYNIVGERETSNLELAQKIASTIGKPLRYEMVNFHQSRPGHDLRYALDGSKLASMGFKFPVGFDDSLNKTIQWFINHPKWLGL